MQKFKTSATPAEISYRQIVQGFINPLKCAYQSINGFYVDYVIRWSTARTRLHAVSLCAICDGAEKFTSMHEKNSTNGRTKEICATTWKCARRPIERLWYHRNKCVSHEEEFDTTIKQGEFFPTVKVTHRKIRSLEREISFDHESKFVHKKERPKDKRSLLKSFTFWSLFFFNLLKNSIKKCLFTISENSPVRSNSSLQAKVSFSSSSFQVTHKELERNFFGFVWVFFFVWIVVFVVVFDS